MMNIAKRTAMDPYDALLRAGEIAAKVREDALSLIEPGRKVIEICDFVHKSIIEMGGKQAFPCNVDINEVAAHYTSPLHDETELPDDSLVKLDIGVHVDGYIADTAVTVCFDSKYNSMVDAAKAALDAAISNVRSGVNAGDIGDVIEKTIKRRGYQPIRNLTGHKMSRFIVHSGSSIPNISQRRMQTLNIGDVYAIEPFTVPHNAAGVVIDGAPSNIYLFKKKHRISGSLTKKMAKYIQSEFNTMPFASRLVLHKFPDGSDAFRELVQSRSIHSYPQLIEKSGMPVAQAEHTIIVTEDGCLVTTA